MGWSDSTTVRMNARYGHFNLEELRSAVETITAPGSPRFHQVPTPRREVIVLTD